jgi:hypothetical protein
VRTTHLLSLPRACNSSQLLDVVDATATLEPLGSPFNEAVYKDFVTIRLHCKSIPGLMALQSIPTRPGNREQTSSAGKGANTTIMARIQLSTYPDNAETPAQSRLIAHIKFKQKIVKINQVIWSKPSKTTITMVL